MKGLSLKITFLVIIILIILIRATFFTVDEKEQVIIVQLGNPIKQIQEPGLNYKIPFLQTVYVIEDRLLEYDAASKEIITQDKKTLDLDNYARWRIKEPITFLKAVRDELGAQTRLDDIIYSFLREELGRYTLNEIVSKEREPIMSRVTLKSNEKAAEYGIEIIDVRIKRADLPAENEKSVFERMQAERNRMANGYRAEGEEEALKIRAQTDKEKTIIMAEAYRESEIIRGEGDAEALRIYADAYQKDPLFFAYMRTLEAYKEALSENTVFILTPEADFFKYVTKAKP